MYKYLKETVNEKMYKRMEREFPEYMKAWEEQCKWYNNASFEDIEANNALSAFLQAVEVNGNLEEYLDELREDDAKMIKTIEVKGWNEYDAEATDNFIKQVEIMSHISVSELANFIDLFNRVCSLVPTDNEVFDDMETIIEPIYKACSDCRTDKDCPECGHSLYYSDLPQYDFCCPVCNENFYKCEVED